MHGPPPWSGWTGSSNARPGPSRRRPRQHWFP